MSIDAAGTLLHPAQRVADVYARLARAHGGSRDAETIARAFPSAMRAAKPLREGDPSWRRYWSEVIARSTGCVSPELVDALYDHYARQDAWRVADDALTCIDALRRSGTRVAVLSNWDLRLRPLLGALGVLDHLDALVVSAECGLEKPDPRIFHHTAAALGVSASAMLHVGDDDEDDVDGATAVGCRALRIDRIGGFAGLVTHVLR